MKYWIFILSLCSFQVVHSQNAFEISNHLLLKQKTTNELFDEDEFTSDVLETSTWGLELACIFQMEKPKWFFNISLGYERASLKRELELINTQFNSQGVSNSISSSYTLGLGIERRLQLNNFEIYLGCHLPFRHTPISQATVSADLFEADEKVGSLIIADNFPQKNEVGLFLRQRIIYFFDNGPWGIGLNLSHGYRFSSSQKPDERVMSTYDNNGILIESELTQSTEQAFLLQNQNFYSISLRYRFVDVKSQNL